MRYSSSPRFYHFAKYRIPIKEPTRKRRKLFDRLAVLNLNAENNMYDNIDDREIETIIEQQIQTHHNSPTVQKRWENTRSFIEYVSKMSDDSD